MEVRFSESEYLRLLQVLVIVGHHLWDKTGPDRRRAGMLPLTLKLGWHAGTALQLHKGAEVLVPFEPVWS
jgi:hypothetical protein